MQLLLMGIGADRMGGKIVDKNSSYGVIQKYYSPELDGLRFVAVLLVFIFHCPKIYFLYYINEYGWIGVDIFLVLSSFLITKLIIIEFNNNGRVDLVAFFIRRALRIWPLYLFYGTTMCVCAVIFGIENYKTMLAWWLSLITFTNNIMIAAHGYPPFFTSHLWTIALEEQSYLIIPMIVTVYLVSNGGRGAAVKFCISAILLLIIARAGLVLVGTADQFLWVSPLRSDAFILGSLLAIYNYNEKLSSIFYILIGLICIFIVFNIPNITVNGIGQVISYTISAIGCTFIVIGTQAVGVIKNFLSRPILRYLGKISFGIYVYHPCAIFIFKKFGFGPVGVMFFGLGLSIMIASLSYKFLEFPFLVLKERYARVNSRPI